MHHLSGAQRAQLRVPVCFQGISDETVVRVEAKVASLGQLGLVMSTFDLSTAQTVGFLGARLEFFLDSKRHLQGEGTDRLGEEVADGAVEVAARLPAGLAAGGCSQ